MAGDVEVEAPDYNEIPETAEAERTKRESTKPAASEEKAMSDVVKRNCLKK